MPHRNFEVEMRVDGCILIGTQFVRVFAVDLLGWTLHWSGDRRRIPSDCAEGWCCQGSGIIQEQSHCLITATFFLVMICCWKLSRKKRECLLQIFTKVWEKIGD